MAKANTSVENNTATTTATVVEQVTDFASKQGLALAQTTDAAIDSMSEAEVRAFAKACKDRIELIGRAAYVDKGGHVIINNTLVGKGIRVNPEKKFASKLNPFAGKVELVNNKPILTSKHISDTNANLDAYVHGVLRLAAARGKTDVSLIGQGDKEPATFVGALAVAKERTW